MHRLRYVALLPVLMIGSGCAWWIGRAEVASSLDYVSAATDELHKGHFDSALDVLMRARGRFPRDEAVLRWNVEVHRMQRQYREALAFLLELSRAEHLHTVTRREVAGQIGDLLFESGDYGRSAHFLYSGVSGPAMVHRRAKADITLALPYIRPQIDYRPIDAKLVATIWPSVLCGFRGKDRLCILDTGSTMSTLSRSVAELVGVTDVRDFGMVRDSLGRKHGAHIGVLKSLSMGGVKLSVLPVLVVEDERLALRDPFGGPENPPMVVLGLDVLSRFRVVFDFSREVVRFDRPGGMVPGHAEDSLLVEGCLVFPMRVDAVDMWFILDTASSHSSLTEAGLAALPGGERRVVPDYRRPKSLAGRGFISRKVESMVLQSSGVRFAGVEMPVVERLTSGVFPVHGVLGVDLLRHCRLTIDSGRILLEQVGSLPSAKSDKR
ncbi:MAG: retropepsin-like aspartic protease [Planctomycetota bacterium]|nr:retropepsin-like aspartic protease [Planctomycetota bacterium]